MNVYGTSINKGSVWLYLLNHYSKSDNLVGVNGSFAGVGGVNVSGGEPFDKLSAEKAFEMIYALRLTEEQLVSNGFPRPGPRAGVAIIKNTGKPVRILNDSERYCGRCGKLFNLSMYDETYVDECNYHPKSAGYRRGKISIEIFPYHVNNLHNLCVYLYRLL